MKALSGLFAVLFAAAPVLGGQKAAPSAPGKFVLAPAKVDVGALDAKTLTLVDLPALPSVLPVSGASIQVPAPVAEKLTASQQLSAAQPESSGEQAPAGQVFDGAARRDDEAGSAAVAVPDVPAALAGLRAASFPRDAFLDEVIGRLVERHPGLPLSPERLFIVRDVDALEPYVVPDHAAGAARLLSDGKEEAKIVILRSPKGVSLPDFIERSIHEALHLKDGAVLKVSYDRLVEHAFIEGYTQLRTRRMADRSLADFGLPPTKNPAYEHEIALVEAFIKAHGEAPLKLLVETGGAEGMEAALGERWRGLVALAAADLKSTRRRSDYFARLAQSVVEHEEFGPDSFRAAHKALHGDDLKN